MRTYARSLDERLINEQQYTNDWIDSKIDTAYEVVATRRQPFQTEEVLDLTDYIKDGTEKFQVDMEYDVLGYKRIFATIGEQPFNQDDLLTSIYTQGVLWKVRPDNVIDIELNTQQLNADIPTTLTFQYYYIPVHPETETYLSSDVYHMIRHGMEFSIYEALRDTEKFQLAQAKLDESARTVINGLDIDIQPADQWNGGF